MICLSLVILEFNAVRGFGAFECSDREFESLSIYDFMATILCVVQFYKMPTDFVLNWRRLEGIICGSKLAKTNLFKMLPNLHMRSNLQHVTKIYTIIRDRKYRRIK
jgi:hypothetical protein